MTIQLVSLLIAPVAALLGVWVSPYLTHRIEHNRWVRDQRASSYIDLIRATQEIRMASVHEVATKLALKELQLKNPTYQESKAAPSSVREMVEKFLKGWTPFINAQAEVELYGNRASAEASRRLVNAAANLVHSYASEENFNAYGEEMTAAFFAFVTAAREDLGIPLQITSHQNAQHDYGTYLRTYQQRSGA